MCFSLLYRLVTERFILGLFKVSLARNFIDKFRRAHQSSCPTPGSVTLTRYSSAPGATTAYVCTPCRNGSYSTTAGGLGLRLLKIFVATICCVCTCGNKYEEIFLCVCIDMETAISVMVSFRPCA